MSRPAAGMETRGALGVTSVGTVLGGIFSYFQHTVCYRTALHPMGYSLASDWLNIDYLWVRNQDFDERIIWMRLSNPAPSVFKSSLRVCIASFPFASAKEQQQETLKSNGKGIALTWGKAFKTQPCSMQSKVSPHHTAWPGLEKTPGFSFLIPKAVTCIW